MNNQPNEIEGRCKCGRCYWSNHLDWRFVYNDDSAGWYCLGCGYKLCDDGTARRMVPAADKGSDPADIAKDWIKSEGKRIEELELAVSCLRQTALSRLGEINDLTARVEELELALQLACQSEAHDWYAHVERGYGGDAEKIASRAAEWKAKWLRHAREQLEADDED